jgi:enoyl-CoA hydratase/carnithine racemase
LSDDHILVEKDSGVATIIFNRPEMRNAISYRMWSRIPEIMRDLDEDPEVRIAVVKGAGDRAFIAGADISEFKSLRSDPENVKIYNAATAAATKSLYNFPKPLIAMINGFCMGGGTSIAVCCDLRIAAENAMFGVPAAKLGLGYGFEGTKILVDIVGPAFAKEILFTGRSFDAREANEMGLVNRVVPVDELESYVVELAETIAANAPLTVKTSKYIVGQCCLEPEKRDLEEVARMVETCFQSEDYKEGARAFMEKRKPAFKGR